MTLPLLLALALVLIVILAVWGLYAARRPSGYPDSGLATSTEGMTVCRHCGMGNLWTEQRCSACGNALSR